jgi:hypothetical protein
MHMESDRQGSFMGWGTRPCDWSLGVRKRASGSERDRGGGTRRRLSSMEGGRAEAINGNFLTGWRYDHGLTFLA